MKKERIKEIIYNMKNEIKETQEDGTIIQWGNAKPLIIILEAILET